MENIVYLLGAGATQGELELAGSTSKTTISDIYNNVVSMSKKRNGDYFKLTETFSMPLDQDIELIMSLFEDHANNNDSLCEGIHIELRELFRKYLISQLYLPKIKPNLSSALLHIHKNYSDNLGKNGEILKGILTTNYDSFIEESVTRIYDGKLNYGLKFISSDYKCDTSVPPLIKLHGSFNWRISKNKIKPLKQFEGIGCKDDYSGWIVPSVYKKPQGVFQKIWQKANELLLCCDTLRVIGSSLRNEDWALISLLFTSQVKRNKPFNIELIIPDTEANGQEYKKGVIQRLSFLTNIKNLSALDIYEDPGEKINNVYGYWLQQQIKFIEKNNPKIGEDDFINEIFE